MLGCHNPRFVCILPAHTASASLHAALSERYPVVDLSPHHGVSPDYLRTWADYPTIVSVRNPFARLVSHYRHSRDPRYIPPDLRQDPGRLRRTEDAQSLGFGGYCRKYAGLLEPIAELLAGIHVDHQVRQEDFRACLSRLPLPGIRKARIYQHHRKPPQDWREYYRSEPEMVRFVQERHRADFVLFNYNPDPGL